jgi:hypothetical protein
LEGRGVRRVLACGWGVRQSCPFNLAGEGRNLLGVGGRLLAAGHGVADCSLVGGRGRGCEGPLVALDPREAQLDRLSLSRLLLPGLSSGPRLCWLWCYSALNGRLGCFPVSLLPPATDPGSVGPVSATPRPRPLTPPPGCGQPHIPVVAGETDTHWTTHRKQRPFPRVCEPVWVGPL